MVYRDPISGIGGGVDPAPGGIARAHRKAQRVDHVRLGREPAVGVIPERDAARGIGHGLQPTHAVGSLVVGVGDVHVGGEVRKSYASTRMPFCNIWDLKMQEAEWAISLFLIVKELGYI